MRLLKNQVQFFYFDVKVFFFYSHNIILLIYCIFMRSTFHYSSLLKICVRKRVRNVAAHTGSCSLLWSEVQIVSSGGKSLILVGTQLNPLNTIVCLLGEELSQIKYWRVCYCLQSSKKPL